MKTVTTSLLEAFIGTCFFIAVIIVIRMFSSQSLHYSVGVEGDIVYEGLIKNMPEIKGTENRICIIKNDTTFNYVSQIENPIMYNKSLDSLRKINAFIRIGTLTHYENEIVQYTDVDILVKKNNTIK
jgi:hypothetical protein